MATRSAALPIERRYLARAWFAVSAVVIAAVAIVAFAVGSAEAPAGDGLSTDTTGRIGEVVDYGPASGSHGPIAFSDGTVCGQCR